MVHESEKLYVPATTVVSSASSATVKVAPSLIVPVSSRAVRSWLGIIYIVNVFVVATPPILSV